MIKKLIKMGVALAVLFCQACDNHPSDDSAKGEHVFNVKTDSSADIKNNNEIVYKRHDSNDTIFILLQNDSIDCNFINWQRLYNEHLNKEYTIDTDAVYDTLWISDSIIRLKIYDEKNLTRFTAYEHVEMGLVLLIFDELVNYSYELVAHDCLAKSEISKVLMICYEHNKKIKISPPTTY